MRLLLVVCVVACVALAAGTVNAAGQISDNTLAQMGLAGLQTMSDVQGAEIRGMGFGAITSATSFAAVKDKCTSATAAGRATATGKCALAGSASLAVADVKIRLCGPGYSIGVKGPVAVSASLAISGGHRQRPNGKRELRSQYRDPTKNAPGV
jgi:hypothetical protein